MYRVRLSYGKTDFNVDLPNNSTVFDLFRVLQKKNYVAESPEEFSIWNSTKLQPIDNTQVAQIVNPKAPTLYLLKKEIGSKVSNFLMQTVPSIIAELADFDFITNQQDGCAIIHKIVQLHTQILNFSEHDASNALLEVIPFEIIETLEGDAIVVELVKWFKEDFFTFAKEFKCHNCQGPTVRLPQLDPPSKTESQHLARITELYKCQRCGAMTRFPRYNSVAKLVETRIGRCGEFANTFAAILNALGLDVRLVDDMNDHIWVEFWSEEKQRYVHVDPCENIVDKPLTYESGWKKKETWVIAVGEGQAADVTPKYTQHLDECIQRRSRMCSEDLFKKIIKYQNTQFSYSLIPEDLTEITERQQKDYQSMQTVKTETAPEEQRPRISGSE